VFIDLPRLPGISRLVYNKFGTQDIVTITKPCRLEWLGHVVRIDGARTVKKLLEGKPAGGRKNRRPRLR
jgi:hypothetical protein